MFTRSIHETETKKSKGGRHNDSCRYWFFRFFALTIFRGKKSGGPQIVGGHGGRHPVSVPHRKQGNFPAGSYHIRHVGPRTC